MWGKYKLSFPFPTTIYFLFPFSILSFESSFFSFLCFFQSLLLYDPSVTFELMQIIMPVMISLMGCKAAIKILISKPLNKQFRANKIIWVSSLVHKFILVRLSWSYWKGIGQTQWHILVLRVAWSFWVAWKSRRGKVYAMPQYCRVSRFILSDLTTLGTMCVNLLETSLLVIVMNGA